MKKKFIKTMIGAGAVAGMLACSVSAYAATVDDVARVARELGYSEDLVQQGYNQYYANPDKYTPEDFDAAIAELYRSMGIIMTTAPQNPEPVTVTTTTASGNIAGENTSVPPENTEPVPETPAQPEVVGRITLSTADGSEFTRISEEEFISMSYEDKMNYIRNFTPEQQQVILDNLSPEEHKSLLKQLPIEQKVEVANSMTNFAETFDLNVSVDEISDDNISLSMRNEEGELVGIANAGTLVEDTGYDRRGIMALSAGLIAVAGILLAAVARLFRTGDEK